MKKGRSAVRRTEKIRYILYGSAAGLMVCVFIVALFVGEFEEISLSFEDAYFCAAWSAFLLLIGAGQVVHIWALRRDGEKWISGDVCTHLGILLALLITLARQFA